MTTLTSFLRSHIPNWQLLEQCCITSTILNYPLLSITKQRDLPIGDDDLVRDSRGFESEKEQVRQSETYARFLQKHSGILIRAFREGRNGEGKKKQI